jgi:hypothetical protein
MKRAGPIALAILVAIAIETAAAGNDASAPTPSRCGGQLWRLKTLSDLRRQSVELQPKSAAIAGIGERPYPRPIPKVRRTPFQRQVWEVVAQITQFRIESSGVRLLLFDGGSYMNAVIPSPGCLSRATRARSSIVRAFKAFWADCGPASGDWQSLGAIVHVRGVGFWSQRRGFRGSARNGAELYPVTGLRVVAGC